MDLIRAKDVLSALVYRRGTPEECRAYLAVMEHFSAATTPTLEKLMRETVEQRRRIRELEAERDEARRQLNVATALGSLLGKELNQATDRIAELEHVKEVATGLVARLATLGTVIAHDDAARILAQALKKHAQDRSP
jgi:hypothetical protein